MPFFLLFSRDSYDLLEARKKILIESLSCYDVGDRDLISHMHSFVNEFMYACVCMPREYV